VTDKVPRTTSLLRSSIGRKFIVALTGVVLVGFVVGHLVGNLQIFLGPEKYNAYAFFLQSLGEALYVVRAVLILSVVAHIYYSIQLALENRAARPVRYEVKNYREATYASRTMHYSGFIVLAFIIYHVMHFTLGKAHPQYYGYVDGQGHHDVYSMVILSFRNPWISGAYIFSMLLLSWHLSQSDFINGFEQSRPKFAMHFDGRFDDDCSNRVFFHGCSPASLRLCARFFLLICSSSGPGGRFRM